MDVIFAKLNVDENPATSAKYRVSGIPTLIFFSDGQRRVGWSVRSARPQIERAIHQYLAT